MIEEQAHVVEVRDQEVVIEASRQSACGQCAQKSDCGQSAIAQWAASKMVNISVDKPLDMNIAAGDTVLVGIDEQSFVKASVLLYLIPLLLMFAAGGVATAMSAVEWVVIVTSFTALIASFYLIKQASKKMAASAVYQLHILKVIS